MIRMHPTRVENQSTISTFDSLRDAFAFAEGYEKQFTAKVKIHPAEAYACWEEGRKHNYRTWALSTSQRYARDLAAGRWNFDLPQNGMVFTPGHSGWQLAANGQHRLYAIHLHGAPVVFECTFNYRGSPLGFDENKIRSANDHIKWTYGIGKARDLGAIATRIEYGLCNHIPKQTASEVTALFARHKNAAEFVQNCFTRSAKGLSQVPVKAAFGRCFYIYGSEKTEHAIAAFMRGTFEPSEANLAILWRWLSSKEYSYGQQGANEVYGKTARALRAHFDGVEILHKLYMPQDEPLIMRRRTLIDE